MSDQLVIWGRLWAIASLLHVYANPVALFAIRVGRWEGLSAALVVIAAVVVLIESSRGRVLFLSGAVVVDAFTDAPFLGNHWLLAALVSLAFLASAGTDSFLPTARLTLVVAYSWIAVSKLNTSFLDPAVSCGTLFASDVTAHFGMTTPKLAGSWLGSVSIWGPLITELSIPFVLTFRRTRHWGVVGALAFHWLVGLDINRHFWDFSSVLIPLFLLFLPAEYWSGLKQRWDGSMSGIRRQLLLAYVVGATLLLLLDPLSTEYKLLTYVGWQIFGLATLISAYRWVRAGQTESTTTAYRVGLVLALIPLLAFLNGLSIYTGLKSAYSWNMYGNLQVVGSSSNHLFLPGLPIDGSSETLVEILASTDEGLSRYPELGYLLPVSQLDSYLATNDVASVTYLDPSGTEVTETNPVRPDTGLREKWRVLRAVDTQDPVRCQDVWQPAR